MHRIKTLNVISEVGTSRLPSELYEIGPDVAEPDALLLRSFKLSPEDIDASVQAIARAGAGTNNIPVADCSERGIPVFNTPGANANAVKELVMAALFLAARNIVPAAAFAHRLEGDESAMAAAVEAGKKAYAGFELPGRSLGVIGLGAIGVEVANAASALGMRVYGYDPLLSVEHALKLSPEVNHVTDLDQLLSKSDIITVHGPLLPETTGLIGAAQLALMQPDAVLVNFARAPIVDEAAVVDALESDRLRGYVCDFPSPALNKRDRVVTLPHLGASTEEAEENCARMAADELRAYLENGVIRNSVNFPAADMSRTPGATRICIANRNIPNMVGQVSTLLASANINIADLLNKSRGNVAYTLVDIDGELPETVRDQIASIDGVLMVRALV
jgi:D-3-phosphoglycerate dehydrogenase